MTRSRVPGLQAAVVVLGVLVVSGGRGVDRGPLKVGGEARADQTVPFTRDFKCYVITPGTALNEPVTLFDQFHPPTAPPPGPGLPPEGGESVTVRSPHLLCTPTNKFRQGDADAQSTNGDGDLEGFHLKCYKITASGPPLNEPVTVFDQFHPPAPGFNAGGGESVTVRTPQLLCTLAVKVRNNQANH